MLCPLIDQKLAAGFSPPVSLIIDFPVSSFQYPYIIFTKSLQRREIVGKLWGKFSAGRDSWNSGESSELGGIVGKLWGKFRAGRDSWEVMGEVQSWQGELGSFGDVQSWQG